MPQDDPLGSDDAGAADQRARRRRGGASASGSGDGGGGDADSGGGAESGGGDKAELQLRKYWAPPQLLLDWQDEQEDRNSTWTEARRAAPRCAALRCAASRSAARAATVAPRPARGPPPSTNPGPN